MSLPMAAYLFFFFNDPATPEIYTLSLHDALPIWHRWHPHRNRRQVERDRHGHRDRPGRSEEHTSELQSHVNLVCRLLLEKKKTKKTRRRLPQQTARTPRLTTPRSFAINTPLHTHE